jgi:hypothetical protein
MVLRSLLLFKDASMILCDNFFFLEIEHPYYFMQLLTEKKTLPN